MLSFMKKQCTCIKACCKHTIELKRNHIICNCWNKTTATVVKQWSILSNNGASISAIENQGITWNNNHEVCSYIYRNFWRGICISRICYRWEFYSFTLTSKAFWETPFTRCISIIVDADTLHLKSVLQCKVSTKDRIKMLFAVVRTHLNIRL